MKLKVRMFIICIMCKISNFKKIHFVGIGGISMSALARFALEEGVKVSGSDEKKSSIVCRLEQLGLSFFCGHEKSNVSADVDVIVYSPAIAFDNPELEEARSLGVPIMNRKDFLALIADEFEFSVAISGSHGKTTTTGMLAHIFKCAEIPMTAHVGGECVDFGGNLLYSKERMLFVTEACEYVDSFLALRSNYSVILNIQSDHMDYFKTEENLVASFIQFANQTKDFVFVNLDDENCLRLCEKVDADKLVGLSVEFENSNMKSHLLEGVKGSTFVARHVKTDCAGVCSFECNFRDENLGSFELSVFGRHNVYNALASIAVAYYYGVDMSIVRRALKTFSGIKRRYEVVGSVNGAQVIHDYAHHPEEITKVIEATREVCTGRIFVVFQPHTYSRTRDLFEQFVVSLGVADKVVMYPIYPAREKPLEGVSSYALSYLIREQGGDAVHFYNFEDIVCYLCENVEREDVVLILGAGDIVELCEMIPEQH